MTSRRVIGVIREVGDELVLINLQGSDISTIRDDEYVMVHDSLEVDFPDVIVEYGEFKKKQAGYH